MIGFVFFSDVESLWREKTIKGSPAIAKGTPMLMLAKCRLWSENLMSFGSVCPKAKSEGMKLSHIARVA